MTFMLILERPLAPNPTFPHKPHFYTSGCHTVATVSATTSATWNNLFKKLWKGKIEYLVSCDFASLFKNNLWGECRLPHQAWPKKCPKNLFWKCLFENGRELWRLGPSINLVGGSPSTSSSDPTPSRITALESVTPPHPCSRPQYYFLEIFIIAHFSTHNFHHINHHRHHPDHYQQCSQPDPTPGRSFPSSHRGRPGPPGMHLPGQRQAESAQLLQVI